MSKPKDQGNCAAKQKQATTKNLSGKRSHSMKKKKNSWKQEKKAKGWACALVMKEGNSMPLYRKLLR